jgi:endogenous inhibitor of DNA gyrase (YacG/DUF329 family)
MTKPCPTCGRPVHWAESPDRPFCSERCRLIDLGHWASEDYVVPGNTAQVEEEAPDEADVWTEDGDR